MIARKVTLSYEVKTHNSSSLEKSSLDIDHYTYAQDIIQTAYSCHNESPNEVSDPSSSMDVYRILSRTKKKGGPDNCW